MPFSNILDLLGRIHLGQTKAVSCGAGFGYMAVDAKGGFFPCHRLTGEADFCAGSLESGVNNGQDQFLPGFIEQGSRRKLLQMLGKNTLCRRLPL